MAQITVTINGRSFRMACDDGEEDRLFSLAERFDGWIHELRGSFGEIGDQRLTVMAGIMATDQLAEVEKKLAKAKAELAELKQEREVGEDRLHSREADTAAALDKVACRIEALAAGLSKSLKPT